MKKVFNSITNQNEYEFQGEILSVGNHVFVNSNDVEYFVHNISFIDAKGGMRKAKAIQFKSEKDSLKIKIGDVFFFRAVPSSVKDQMLIITKYRLNNDKNDNNAYVTLSNIKKIVYKSDLDNNLNDEVYKIPIYFFSKYEEKSLLAIKELLKDPAKYFSDIYKPRVVEDTFTYIYEEGNPAYHKYSCCPILNSNFYNYKIPKEIIEKGDNVVKDFRIWFKNVEHLLDKPDIFTLRLFSKWGISSNPKSINFSNSGFIKKENLNLNELESKIDRLIKNAGVFYYKSSKNKTILKRFSKLSFLYKEDEIKKNDTPYTDEEVKGLLKYYDDTFKGPLKKLLIEYYKLKFNPNIEMKDYLFEQLGFVPCSHCHDDNYSPDI